MSLWSVARLASHKWKADTQEIEGIMNMIQANASKGRPSLALVDARVANRKDLTYSQGGGKFGNRRNGRS